MSEKTTVPPSGDAVTTPVVGGSLLGTPGKQCAKALGREARADSVERLLEAVSEYERTVSLLLAAVLRLRLPGMDQGMGDADGPGANRKPSGDRPNG